MRRRPPCEEGFTLIEAVIAIAIMGIVVVVLVGALAGLISASQFHRGNAVAETSTRNVSQALIARAGARTSLKVALGAASGATSITVGDASDFPDSGFISVDLEIMKVTARTATTLSVVRGAARSYDSWPSGDPTSVVAHQLNAFVAPALMCASVGELTPDPSRYVNPAGVSVTVSAVEYWDPATKTFLLDRDTCIAKYKARCRYNDQANEDLRLDCDGGLQRVTLSASTAGDSRLKGVTGSTQFLLRRGSAS